MTEPDGCRYKTDVTQQYNFFQLQTKCTVPNETWPRNQQTTWQLIKLNWVSKPQKQYPQKYPQLIWKSYVDGTENIKWWWRDKRMKREMHLLSAYLSCPVWKLNKMRSHITNGGQSKWMMDGCRLSTTEACVCNRHYRLWDKCNFGGTEGDWEVWSCRSPDWPWGSDVERALVEREWRREAAGDRRGGQHPDQGLVKHTHTHKRLSSLM